MEQAEGAGAIRRSAGRGAVCCARTDEISKDAAAWAIVALAPSDTAVSLPSVPRRVDFSTDVAACERR